LNTGNKKVFVISGVKNSGKTTLVCRLLEIFSEMGWKVATIKHDGHDFEADVYGTDSYRHFQAGAYGTVIFSDKKYMVVKEQQVTEEELMNFFPEADLILLEGFKYSPYPKIEVIRKGNSKKSVCSGFHLEAVVTDLEREELEDVSKALPVFNLNNPKQIADFIIDYQISRGNNNE
jgi:molybdopterin-guanine dinucleotide biosynthesis protein B